MSYDLHFLHAFGRPPLTLDSLRAYFLGREHYAAQGTQFWYQNEDTGVYFSFDFIDDASPDDELDDDEDTPPPLEDGLEATPLAFNINYYRPHFFGLEAAPELSALVHHFEFLVDDPQVNGMGRGSYSSSAFLSGWNAGNMFSHYAMHMSLARGEQPVSPPQVDVLPSKVLEGYWTWNYERGRLQTRLGEAAFVPSVRPMRWGDRVISVVVWADAIPQLIPSVDYLILVRQELAPSRFLRGKKQDTCLVPFVDLERIAHHAKTGEVPARHLFFDHESPPRALIDFFRDQRHFDGKLDGLSWDSVLTAEVLEEARLRLQRRDA